MNKRLKKAVSVGWVIFAMIMFFAHLVIPHHHSTCSGYCEVGCSVHHHHTEDCRDNCQSTYYSNRSEGDHHHHSNCIITTDLPNDDHQKSNRPTQVNYIIATNSTLSGGIYSSCSLNYYEPSQLALHKGVNRLYKLRGPPAIV